ncbi:MAG: molybdopterin-dependent oxidoreductase [Cyclobacteriaceae bacterium]
MTTQKHYRTCNLCEAMCGLEIEYTKETILSIKGDKNDPFSQGHICPKAVALKDVYEDKNRLKKPVKKTESGWEEISWSEAFNTVGKRIHEIQTQYGKTSIGFYNGNPVVHNSGTLLSAPSFFRELGTTNRYSATSVDQLPHHFSAYLMFGHQLMLPIPDIDRTDYLVILGANPLVSNGSLLTAPNMKKRLADIQARGGKVVNIDPRFTETSEKCDQHVYIKAGTDVYLLLAMINTLFDEGLVDTGRLTSDIKGLNEIRDLVQNYSPGSIEQITGISSQVITNLTREFCTADKAVLYGRMGVCTQEFGGASMWLVNVFNILTGNFDEPGGAMFSSPAIDVKATTSKGHIGKWHSRVRDFPEFANELPVATLAEDILTEGKGQIKGMIINAGNPILSTPNSGQLAQAFDSLDFMVSIDIFINETSSMADIILPPATGVEVGHYDLVFHSLAVRNTTKYSSALFPKSDGAKYDWEIFKLLRKSYLKATGRYGPKKRIKLFFDNFITPEKMIGVGLKRSKYGSKVSLGELKNNPHGIDLGPLESQLPKALFTSDKKINLYPNAIENDLTRIADKLRSHGTNSNKIKLVGRRQLRTCNSWLHNSPRMSKNNDCTLLIHPNTADKFKLEKGNPVKVVSASGSITLPMELTNKIAEDTVSIPHGWGHTGDIQLDVATANPGANINVLMSDQQIDELTGNAVLNGVEVELQPA